ncbi:AfsR/SARP family transcriptional regulator [Dactylosporangium sp. CA-152071]|uniref:AfsR/SARP family transcriptional regulator n=1 Tax=Dactylosporangium sp. CA-152071 TaxID=3239933 RepID=UPI003D910EEA
MRIIGHVAVLDPHGRPVPGLRGRAKDLLTYLAIHPGGANLPDIMEALWPAATVTRAADSLSTEVANLRSTVRKAAGDRHAQAVHNLGGRYTLNADLLDIDLWQLEQAVAADNPAAPDRQQRLRAAAALYAGDLATTAAHGWLEAARERCRQHTITAHQRLAAALEVVQPAEAAALLDAADGIDPYNETLALAAINAFAALGATDQAQHRYE